MKTIKRVIIVIFILIILIVAIMLKVVQDIKVQEEVEKEEEVIIDNSIHILENRNIFYTIATCIDKYSNYIAEKDINSLIDILDKEYIESHSITEHNILNSIDKFDTKQINVVRNVYEQEVDKYNSIYYVYYTARNDTESQVEDGFFGEVERASEKDKYLIVKLNYSNETFSVMPYNGEIFINN